jgi:hypothetical protein
VATVLLVYDRRWLLPGVCLMGLILTASFLPVYLANPHGFWDDARFTLAIRTGISPLLQIVNVVLNYAELVRRESWMVVGIIGLGLLPQRRAKLMILFVVGVTVLVTVRTPWFSLHLRLSGRSLGTRPSSLWLFFTTARTWVTQPICLGFALPIVALCKTPLMWCLTLWRASLPSRSCRA